MITGALLAILASPAQAYLCGDLNGSKSVTAADALTVLKLGVGQDIPVDCGSQSRTLVTGLTQCSNAAGAFIDCDGTGQDGELQKGAPRAFVDNGNGTVTDRGTGLQWELFDSSGGVHDMNNKLDQDGAYAKIAGLNAASFAGHADWRLPNAFELMSLGNFGASNGLFVPYFKHDCTPGCALPNCACVESPSYEWSSTSLASQPSYAFALRTVVGDPIIQTKTLLNYTARAVRGGYSTSDVSGTPVFARSCADVNASDSITASDALAILRNAVGQDVDLSCVLRSTTLATGQAKCFSKAGGEITCAGSAQDGELKRGIPRVFSNNEDGTVLDEKTGLVWELLTDDGSVHDRDNQYTWIGAQTKIAQLNDSGFAGYSDWRMPNFFELQSLVNFGDAVSAAYVLFNNDCANGCTSLQCSCQPATGSIWSSTTPLNNKVYALKTSFVTGRADWELKTASLNVRGVRAGN